MTTPPGRVTIVVDLSTKGGRDLAARLGMTRGSKAFDVASALVIARGYSTKVVVRAGDVVTIDGGKVRVECSKQNSAV